MKEIDLRIRSLFEEILAQGTEGESACLAFAADLAENILPLLNEEAPWDERPRRALFVLRFLARNRESVARTSVWSSLEEMDSLLRWTSSRNGIGSVPYHSAHCLQRCVSAAWSNGGAEDRARVFSSAVHHAGEACSAVGRGLSAHERLESELEGGLFLSKTAACARLSEAAEVLSASGGPKSSAGDGHDPRVP